MDLSGGRVSAAPDRVEIVIEVDELVLDGFDRIDRDLVAATFHRELTRLLSAGAGDRLPGTAPLAARSDRDVDALADLPTVPATTSSRHLGRALAHTVHAGLTGLPAVPATTSSRRLGRALAHAVHVGLPADERRPGSHR